MFRCSDNLRKGYSLVEVSLALLVIGVGLLAVFALFPEGLGAARRAVDDVEIGAFADFVFSSLAYEAADINELWSSFGSNTNMDLMILHSLEVAGQPRVVADAEGTTAVREFYWIPFFYGDQNKWAVSAHKVATFTYRLWVSELRLAPPAKYARLEVWAGEFQGETPPGPGKVFYREFLPVK